MTLSFVCATVSLAQPTPFVDLARHDPYREVKISPDGKYLAATAILKGHSVMALINLADKKAQRVRPRKDDDVTDFWWASAKRVVYTASTRGGGYDKPLSTGKLYAVNLLKIRALLQQGQILGLATLQCMAENTLGCAVAVRLRGRCASPPAARHDD